MRSAIAGSSGCSPGAAAGGNSVAAVPPTGGDLSGGDLSGTDLSDEAAGCRCASGASGFGLTLAARSGFSAFGSLFATRPAAGLLDVGPAARTATTTAIAPPANAAATTINGAMLVDPNRAQRRRAT